MASNRFGEIFSYTTWGESHGPAIGVVIDGCPSGVPFDEAMLNDELVRRAPGRNPVTSPRNEPDIGQILSGVFEGVTTGAPISIVIKNRDADSSKYEPIKEMLRPGHANYGYLEKYGIFDYRGGGRASARETACRVAAGAVAKQLLVANAIDIVAYISQVGDIHLQTVPDSYAELKRLTRSSAIACPDLSTEAAIVDAVLAVKGEGDSLGGCVTFRIEGLPPGFGDPIYQKLDARLAAAMMSIPATKGFELGSGFEAAAMRGSEHNDLFVSLGSNIATSTNHSGGVLGGISTGMPVTGRVAFKPTSSIGRAQQSVDSEGRPVTFELPKGSRHDPCVALRAPAIVEAMAAVVVADALLMARCSQSSVTASDSARCLEASATTE